MKRIAILVNEFAPAQGGVGNQAYYLARYLSDVCQRVIVITFHQTNDDFGFDEQQPFKIYRRKILNWRLGSTFRLMNYVIRTLKEEQTDTIIISNYFFLWLLPVIRLFYPKARYATIIHGSELRQTNLVFRTLTYTGLLCSEKIIAVSSYTKSILKKSPFYKKINVCHIGIPDELISDKVVLTKPSPLKLATIGSFTKKKGYINVFKVLPVLFKKYPDSTYKVCGITNTIEFYNTVNKYSNEILLKSRIEPIESFTNSSIDQMCAFFSDVGIYMALAEQTNRGDVEGYGIALLEANARGVPVVATNNFGFKETVKNKYSGILVNPHNEEEVLAAIDEIVHNYSVYSTNAKKWAYQHRWSLLYKSYYNVINS